MYYYEVLVGDSQYHGDGPLTYSWSGELVPGSVVKIPLRNRSVLGLVIAKVHRPNFTVKPITSHLASGLIPTESIKLIEWMYDYYPSPLGAIVKSFLPPSTSFPKTSDTASSKSNRDVIKGSHSRLPTLTREQFDAISIIDKSGSYLLHGITGSGKTRLYLELAKRSLREGRSVIILTPEIGLTEHLVQSFSDVMHKKFVLHSRLTTVARRDIWHDILSCREPAIVMGPRSALFTPLNNIGLIIMDESHDQAYKSDNAPHYRTDRVAARLAGLHKAIFVSGSATPNVEDVYMFEAKKLPVVKMTSLAKSTESQTAIKTVDLREKNNFTKSRVLGTPLINAIETSLGRHEQTLLFLNRRGTASAVLCSNCGWRATCSRCDLPVTYHGDKHELLCHVCGRRSSIPPFCPDCGQTDITFKTIGTKAVVDEVQRLFPTARIKRFDTDSQKTDHIEHQLELLRSGGVDIIVGTQMITKGLDLPNLAIVGVLNADSSLLMPDFTANERTYQLISQVIGRVGRGHRPGAIFLQTYNPEHPTLQAALAKDWDGFYEHELNERHRFRFPPFCYLLRLTCLRATQNSAEKSASKLSDALALSYPGATIEGPSPSFHPKESGKYKWQIIIKSSSRSLLIDIIHHLPSGWQYDIDPVNLL